MKHVLAIVAFALVTLCPAQAEPASVESVETLLRVTKSDRILDVMNSMLEQSIRDGMVGATAGKTLTPEQQRLIQTMPQKFAQVLREELNWDSLKSVVIPIYTETFDQAEIDGVIAFYSTPAGQQFVDKQPLVAQRTAAAMQERMKSVMPKLQAAMNAALQEAGLK